MFTVVVVAVLAFFIFISWLLWKSGFLFEAEKPVSVLDVPITDARARTAFLKRLERWRGEGKLSREEYEHLLFLCEHEWKS
jgi:hypothetical protein